MSGTNSPSLLTPPNRRTPGVRRLNYVPILAGGCAVAAIVFAVGYTMVDRAKQQQITTKQEAETTKTQGSKAPDYLAARKPEFTGKLEPAETDKAAPAAATPPQPTVVNSGTSLDEQARTAAWQAWYADRAQQIAQRNQMEQQALKGNMDPLQGKGGGDSANTGRDRSTAE